MYVAEQKVDYRKIHRPMVTPVSQLQYLLLGGPASRLRRRVIGQESVGLRGVLTGVFGLGRCLFFFLVFFLHSVSARHCKTEKKENIRNSTTISPPGTLPLPSWRPSGTPPQRPSLTASRSGELGSLCFERGSGMRWMPIGRRGLAYARAGAWCRRNCLRRVSGRGGRGGSKRDATYRGPGPAFLATKLSLRDFTLGERRRFAGEFRSAANVFDTGVGILAE